MQQRGRRYWLLSAAVATLFWAGQTAAVAYPPPTATASQTCLNRSGNLFGGTCACASANWTAGSGTHITEVEIFVNNTRILNQTSFPGGGCDLPPPSAVGLRFSTTAWPDGTPLIVTVKVHQSDGQVATATSQGPVAWNKGYLMYNQQFDFIYPWWGFGPTINGLVYGDLGSMNHLVTNGLCNDTKPTIIGTPPYYYDGRLFMNSVAYLYTHGGEYANGAPTGDLADCEHPNEQWMSALGDIAPAVNAKASGSLPVPRRFNFVFADACYSACGACYSICPGRYGPGGGHCELKHVAFESVAYFGWTDKVTDDQTHANFTTAFWYCLSQQASVHDARAIGTGNFRIYFVLSPTVSGNLL